LVYITNNKWEVYLSPQVTCQFQLVSDALSINQHQVLVNVSRTKTYQRNEVLPLD